MQTFLLLSAVIGVTLIVARSTLLRPLRALWPAFFGCSQCVGFWVGVTVGASGILPGSGNHVLDATVVGAATSFLSMFADAALLNLLGDPNDNTQGPGRSGQ